MKGFKKETVAEHVLTQYDKQNMSPNTPQRSKSTKPAKAQMTVTR